MVAPGEMFTWKVIPKPITDTSAPMSIPKPIVERNDLANSCAVATGMIMIADTSSAPTTRIDTATVTADMTAISMERAIDETNRRRAIQVAYNTEHGIDPQPLRKKIADITDILAREEADTDELVSKANPRGRKPTSPVPGAADRTRSLDTSTMAVSDLADLVQELTDQMKAAAAELQFELAARLRDEIGDLKKELRSMIEANR